MTPQIPAALSVLRGAASMLDRYPGVAGTAAQSPQHVTLQGAIADTERAVAARSDADAARHKAVLDRRFLHRSLLSDHIRPILAVANQERGALRHLFLRPPNARVRQDPLLLCQAADVIAGQVERCAHLFIEAGLALDFLDQLRGAIAAVRDAELTARTSRIRRAGAKAGANAAVKQGREAVRVLNHVLAKRLREAGLWAEWKAVTRVRPSAATHSALPPAPPAPPSDVDDTFFEDDE